VSQERADVLQRGALPQQRCRDGVPKEMCGASARARHASLTQRSGDHDRYTARAERAKRRPAPNKQCLGLDLWPAMLQVLDDRFTHLLGQRSWRMAATLATHVNPCAFPVDVAQLKVRDIAGSQAQTGQQQQNRSIPSAQRRGAVA